MAVVTPPPEIAETVSTIPAWKHRNTVITIEDQDEFVATGEALFDHLSASTQPEMNTVGSEMNALSTWMETTAQGAADDATAAATSATEAETYKDLAATSANYKGVWSAGTYGLGDAVSHNGYIWKSDIASNTSEPGVANWTAVARIVNNITKTAAYTAINGDFISVDTLTTGAFTITLPLSPNENDIIQFLDIKGNLATANLTIGRNGETIMGLAEDMSVKTDNASFGLIFTNNDWRAF